MKSLTPTYLDKLRLSAADGSMLKALGECRGRQEVFTRQTPGLVREHAIGTSSWALISQSGGATGVGTLRGDADS